MTNKKEEKIIVPLEYPIQVTLEGHDITVHQVELGRIKAKHLLLFPKKFFDDGEIIGAEWIPLVQGLSELPKESVDEFDAKDILNIVKVIKENFL